MTDTVTRPLLSRIRDLGPTAAVFGVVLLAAGYLAFRGAPDLSARLRPTDPPIVSTRVVGEAGGYDERRSHVGRVEAARASRVGGELGGVVLEVLVDEGDDVAADTPIARFDVARLAARRAQIEADLARQGAVLAELDAGPRAEDIAAQQAEVRRADAAAALAESTADRVKQAFDADAVSQQEWDEARLRAEQARAAHDAARAQLEELEAGTRDEQLRAQAAAVKALEASLQSLDVDIDKAVVRAPFAGRVAARYVDEGEVLAPGAPIVELRERPDGDGGAPEIRVGVLPDLADRLRPGDEVPVRYRGVDAEAVLSAVRSDRTRQTRTVPVLLRLREGSARPPLRDGELVEVRFTRRIEENAFALPLASLTEGARGLWRCFVVEPIPDGGAAGRGATHTLVARTVEVLHFDEETAYVRGVIHSGERIVDRGTHRLVPGLRVRVVEEVGR